MIDFITIKNFKCFKETPVRLNNLTVLAGANGVGKSTVIQSLLLIRQTIDSFIPKNAISAGTEINNWAVKAKILLNHAYLLQLGNSKELMNAGSGSSRLEFILKTSDEVATFGYDASSSSLSLLSDQISSNLYHEGFNISRNSFHYLNAERLGPRSTQEITEQAFISTGFQGELTGQALLKAEIANLKLDEYDKRIFAISENKALYKISSQVEAWMKFIIPEIEVRVDPFIEINSVRVSLKKQGSESDFLHPNNIGFGITYVLPIVVTGLIAEKGSMVIVENPEAHLHPSGQSRIGQFLTKIASEGIQVIVETHSEHLINGVRIGYLKKFLPNNNITINFFSQASAAKEPVITEVEVTDSGDLSDWPYGFFDQEQQDFAEMTRIKNSKNGKSSS